MVGLLSLADAPCGMFGPTGRISHTLLGCEITLIRFGVLLALGLIGAVVGGRGLLIIDDGSHTGSGILQLLCGASLIGLGMVLFAGLV